MAGSVLGEVEFRFEVGGVVGAADEGAGGDVAEALAFGDDLEVGELVRVDVFDDGEVLFRRAEVLAEGEDGDAGVAEVVHGLEDFGFGFAEAEHDAAFGGDLAAGHFFGAFEDVETAVVLGAAADERGEALDGFEVVIEDVGAGVDDGLEGVIAAVEVRDEDFDDDAGVFAADGFDGACEVEGTAVLEVVAGDGGDDDMIEVHAFGGFGDAVWFVGFEGEGLGGFDGAEAAGAGAAIACDHEGGGSLAPAFPAVGALSFLADRVEFEV